MKEIIILFNGFFTLFVPYMLLHRNNSQHMHCLINHLWHISNPTCFGTEVPSTGESL